MAVKKRGKARWRSHATKKRDAVDAARPLPERIARAEKFILFLRSETEKQTDRLYGLRKDWRKELERQVKAKKLRRKWKRKSGR